MFFLWKLKSFVITVLLIILVCSVLDDVGRLGRHMFRNTVGGVQEVARTVDRGIDWVKPRDDRDDYRHYDDDRYSHHYEYRRDRDE